MVMICYDRIDRIDGIDRIDCLFVNLQYSFFWHHYLCAQEMIQSPSDGLQWPGWKKEERWWDLMGTIWHHGHRWGPWFWGNGFPSSDLPQKLERRQLQNTANRFTKFHQFLKRLDEIGYFSTNSTERSHETSWNSIFLPCSRYGRMPRMPCGLKFGFYHILSISRWLKLWLQSHPWLGVRRQVASGGVRCVSPTRSRNSRHLRFFVFSRIREKLNNSEQFWTIPDTCKEAQEFYGRSIIATFCFILAASWLFFKAQGFCTQGQGGGLWGTRWVSSSASSTSEYASRRLLPSFAMTRFDNTIKSHGSFLWRQANISCASISKKTPGNIPETWL